MNIIIIIISKRIFHNHHTCAMLHILLLIFLPTHFSAHPKMVFATDVFSLSSEKVHLKRAAFLHISAFTWFTTNAPFRLRCFSEGNKWSEGNVKCSFDFSTYPSFITESKLCSHSNCLHLHLATQFTFATLHTESICHFNLGAVRLSSLRHFNARAVCCGRLSAHGCIRAVTRIRGSLLTKIHEHTCTFVCTPTHADHFIHYLCALADIQTYT